MSQAITELINQHDKINNALEIFQRVLDDSLNRSAIDLLDLEKLMVFLKEFVDLDHHGKEESCLFPTLIAFGLPDRGGPVGVLMAEHIRGRGLLFNLDEMLDEEPLDWDRFRKIGFQYIDLLKAHIQKENSVLFPMAERVIPITDLDGMILAFKRHEEKTFSMGRRSELYAILDDLASKYSQ